MRLLLLASGTFMAVVCGGVYAQGAFPTKTVRIVVPFPPGGSNDVLARAVGEKLGGPLGQQVVIDNRPGAGGVLGSDLVAKSAPDGHTLLLVSSSFTIQPAMQADLPFDPATSFVPVSMIGSGPLLLVVHPALPVKSVADLIQFMRKRPGEFNAATPGSGTINHLASEFLKSTGRLDFVHVHYKGASPALTELVGGQVHLLVSSLSAAMPLVKAGRVRALAVTSAERSPVLPDVPPIAAAVPGYAVDIWWGLVAAAKTPPAAVQRLNTEIIRTLDTPELKERLAREGVSPAKVTPDQFSKIIVSEIARWRGLVAEAKIRAE